MNVIYMVMNLTDCISHAENWWLILLPFCSECWYVNVSIVLVIQWREASPILLAHPSFSPSHDLKMQTASLPKIFILLCVDFLSFSKDVLRYKLICSNVGKGWIYPFPWLSICTLKLWFKENLNKVIFLKL